MGLATTLLLIVFLITLSAVCSGLNIAVMSLNLADLRRKAKLGDRRAQQMLPLRRNAHLTLAAILLTNVAAASAAPLVIGSRLNGFVAGTISTLLLVIFAEIMPQAIFTRNALKMCARFHLLIRFMIVITYPLSRPLQWLLDQLFGPPRHELHTRHELAMLIEEHKIGDASELDEDEIEIIQGALKLSEKRVRDIMTPIEDVYWLTPDTLIDESRIDEIKARIHSRIPVFNRKLTTCYGILLIRDLIDIDFDEEPQLVSELPLYPSHLVGSLTALDTMFRKFIAAKSHLIPIEKDDQIVGIVTIEDLLEEIIGHEIEDETDRR